MTNFKNQNTTELTTLEINTINGGNDHTNGVMDDGSGNGCTRPIIVIGPSTGPTFPNPEDILF